MFRVPITVARPAICLNNISSNLNSVSLSSSSSFFTRRNHHSLAFAASPSSNSLIHRNQTFPLPRLSSPSPLNRLSYNKRCFGTSLILLARTEPYTATPAEVEQANIFNPFSPEASAQAPAWVEKISEFRIKNKYACFIQKNFQAKINNLNTTEENWPGTKICQKKFLKSPQWLRNLKIKKRKIWNFYKDKEPQIIFDGGWHFSFLKKNELIQKKIKSFAHQEFNKNNLTNLENIKKRVNSGTDIFDRPFKYKKVELDKDFPEYILDNRSKFKDWII